MEPFAVAALGLAMGMTDLAIGRRVDRRASVVARDRFGERSRDYYVLAWYAFAGTGFLASGHAAVFWSGVDSFALLGTLRAALVVSFLIACTCLLAAGGHHLAASRASPHPKG